MIFILQKAEVELLYLGVCNKVEFEELQAERECDTHL